MWMGDFQGPGAELRACQDEQEDVGRELATVDVYDSSDELNQESAQEPRRALSDGLLEVEPLVLEKPQNQNPRTKPGPRKGSGMVCSQQISGSTGFSNFAFKQPQVLHHLVSP